MYPSTLTKDLFFKLKRDFFIKKQYDSVSVEELIKTGKLTSFTLEVETKLKEKMIEWEAEFPPKLLYQVSSGTQYASDDPIFIDEIDAIDFLLEESKNNLDNFYVLWEFEDNFLPYPSKVFFDGKVYSKDDRYDVSFFLKNF